MLGAQCKCGPALRSRRDVKVNQAGVTSRRYKESKCLGVSLHGSAFSADLGESSNESSGSLDD